MKFIVTFEQRLVFVIALAFFVVTASVGGPLLGVLAAAAISLVLWFLKLTFVASFPLNSPAERYEEFSSTAIDEIFLHKFALSGYALAALVVVSFDFYIIAQIAAIALVLLGVVGSLLATLPVPFDVFGRDD